jgi:hypothetical protein
MFGIFFVLFGGIFLGKNRGAIYVYLGGGGGCIFWGEKIGGNFVIFGGILFLVSAFLI